MAAETCWNLRSENLMSPHLALTFHGHEKCFWSWPQWVQAVRLSVVPGQRSSMQLVIQFCLLFKSLPPWSPVLTLCLSDSCVFNWITICSWGGPFLFRRGMHELIYLPDCARYFLFALTTTTHLMHFLSFSAWGLSYGYYQQGFHSLVSIYFQPMRKWERKERERSGRLLSWLNSTWDHLF